MVAGRGFGRVVARGFGAAFGFGLVAVFVAVAVPLFLRSPPNRVGRVAGRLPRTLSSSVFSLICRPVYVSRAYLGAIVDASGFSA